MAATEVAGGVVYVKADGIQLSAEGTVTVMFSKEKREGKAAMDGRVVRSRTPLVPYVEGTYYLTASTDIEALEAIETADVKVELASGKTGTLRNAYACGEAEVDSSAGTFKLRFEGSAGIWDNEA